MTIEEQPGFDPRLAWASEGGTLLAGVCPVLVVVDILRFTTAVEVAVTHGARVIPERWVGREGPGLSSLSPVSLLGIPAGTRVTLASPNGATVSLDLADAGAVVLAGCLRNASAVAASAGKKASKASSDSVMSSGVPNTVVVLKNERMPCSVVNCTGTRTPANSRPVGGRPERVLVGTG